MLKPPALIFSLISALALFSCHWAEASSAQNECAFTRLDQNGGSMEHVTVRDQDEFGDCYAEAAAQMADAWRFSHGDTRYTLETSALAASIETSHKNSWKNLESTDPKDRRTPCQVVQFLSANGACTDSILKAKDKLKVPADSYLHDFYEWAQGLARARMVGQQQNAGSTDTMSTPEGIAGEICRTMISVWGFSADELPSFNALEKSLEENAPTEVMDILLSRECSQDKHFKYSLNQCSDLGGHVLRLVEI